MNRNLILGTAFGYTKKQLKIFVESWIRHQSYNSELFLVIEPDASEEKQQYLIDSNANILYFSSAYFIPSAIHNTRYFRYLDFLMEYSESFDNVFLTDVRDVAFQGDIFDYFGNSNINTLNVFQEDQKWTLEERFNRHILINNYGEAVADELKNERILCSGTTLGPIKNIIEYIVALMNQRSLKKMVEVGGIPDEQAPYNYLFHKNILNHIQRVNNNGVSTLCLVDPKDITIKKERILVRNVEAPVVHQFDRHPNLVEFLEKLYE